MTPGYAWFGSDGQLRVREPDEPVPGMGALLGHMIGLAFENNLLKNENVRIKNDLDEANKKIQRMAEEALFWRPRGYL